MKFEFWTIVALTLVATALRFADTAARTYWLDEGFTLYRVLGSWGDLALNRIELQGMVTTDIHPQLYFAALKLWILAGGLSEFSLRAFSLLSAVMLVPMTYVMSRRTFGARAGIISALLVVLCPAYQWYGWEVRMYSVTPLLAALTSYLLVRALAGPRLSRRFLILWASVSVIAVLTHYSSASLLLAHALVLGVVIFGKMRAVRPLRLAALGLGIAAVFVAVFAIESATGVAGQFLRQVSGFLASRLQQPVTVLSIVHDVLGASIFGMNAADPTDGYLEGLVAVLITLGVVLPRSRFQADRRSLMGLSIVVPILFWALLSYVLENRPSFRYVIIVVPAMHTVLGRVGAAAWDGLDISRRSAGFWRWARSALGAAAVTLTLALNTFGLANTFVHTSTWQDEWLTLSRFLLRYSQPGDALIINDFTPEPVLRQYLGDLRIEMIPVRELRNLGDTREAREQLQSTHSRIWHANTGGDQGVLSAEIRALLAPFDRVRVETFPARSNILRLERYDTRPFVADAIPPGAHALAAQVASVATRPVAYDFKPGEPFDGTATTWLTVYWQRGSGILVPSDVSVRLLDKEGATWMHWNFPADLGLLPRGCAPGKICSVDYSLLLPPGLPPQAYSLEFTPVASTGQPTSPSVTAPLDPSTLACCVRITGQRASAPAQEFSGVALETAEYADTLHPGDAMSIVLTWQLRQSSPLNWTTRLSLAPIIGSDVAAASRTAGPPDLPPSAWPAAELIRDQYSLPLPPTLGPGLFRLSLTRAGPGIPEETRTLGLVSVEPFPRSPVPTQIPVSLDAQVGPFTLLGYALDGPFERGKTVSFRTLWRVDDATPRNGVLAAYVLSSDGNLIAQDDNSPDQGKRETQTFRAGEGIDQLQRLALPTDLPAGEYRVLAGIYDRAGGARWPALRDRQPARDDLVPLMTFTLPEPPAQFKAFLPVVSTGDTAQ